MKYVWQSSIEKMHVINKYKAMEDKICYSGLTAGGLLQAMLICLKAANLTTWSWWMVFLPTWIGFAVLIASLIIVSYFVLTTKPKKEEPIVEEPKDECNSTGESTVSITSAVSAEKMSKPVVPSTKPKKKVEKVIPVVEDQSKVIVVTVAEEDKKEEPVKKTAKKSKAEPKVEPKVEPKEDAPKDVKEAKPKAKKSRKKKADGEDTKPTAKGDTDK